MSFIDDIKNHLCRYKSRKYPDLENGFWMRSNPPKELCYAFRKKDDTNNDEDENIISHYQDNFLKSKFKDIKRHLYFHHMNSSQAMCINFFFPLLSEHKLELITEYLGFPGEKIKYETVAFEKKSTIESAKGHRPTSFDFFFETTSGKKFFFEIKYTERDFGKAPMDEDHIKKFNKVYRNHLGPAIKPRYHAMNEFLNNYQLMRNLIHIDDNSYVVLVYPYKNKKVKLESKMALKEIVATQFASHILPVELDDIFDFVSKKVSDSELKAHYDEFGNKYFFNP